ncbi:cyclic lactone autoinducer peptide AgrD [Staphylococcus epidermidis]
MENIFNLFIKFFTTILEFIGTVAGDVCASYFDEPEVPEELTKLYE